MLGVQSSDQLRLMVCLLRDQGRLAGVVVPKPNDVTTITAIVAACEYRQLRGRSRSCEHLQAVATRARPSTIKAAVQHLASSPPRNCHAEAVFTAVKRSLGTGLLKKPAASHLALQASLPVEPQSNAIGRRILGKMPEEQARERRRSSVPAAAGQDPIAQGPASAELDPVTPAESCTQCGSFTTSLRRRDGSLRWKLDRSGAAWCWRCWQRSAYALSI